MSRTVRGMGMVAVAAAMMVLSSTEASAGNRSGTVTGQFLKLSTGARAVAMGGAQVAVAEGVNSMAYNPAGIMAVGNYGFGATYTQLYAEIQHSYIGAVKNIPGLGAVGVSVVILTTDDMLVTTPAFPEGTGEKFKASDYAIGISFARQVTDQFRVGVNAKLIKSYLYNAEVGTSSFAFDIGTLYDIPVLKSHIGVSLTNLGKDLTFVNETYSLPTALRFGVLVDLVKDEMNEVVTTLQITRVNDADEQYNLGGEYVFNGMVALRAGWKFAYDQEDITGGFGVKLNSLGVNSTLDYAYNNFKFLPGTHTITFEVMF
ncbi:MAG TPA: PorV/PorQ family protein [Bacteroidota bacterium]|nr:PorV/PorQ family protein [Bacteroidota bacterium]